MARKPKNLEQLPDGNLALIEPKETILIHKIKPVRTPERHGACWDLFLPEDVTVQPGTFFFISLGIAVKLPKGYHAKLMVRSSTPLKWGIVQANSIGIIDNGYCGNEDEWKLLVFRPNGLVLAYPFCIPAGTRIAQFSIEKDAPEMEFKEVETMPDPSRGGFGSTGK